MSFSLQSAHVGDLCCYCSRNVIERRFPAEVVRVTPTQVIAKVIAPHGAELRRRFSKKTGELIGAGPWVAVYLVAREPGEFAGLEA